jgi:hypothetical protein
VNQLTKYIIVAAALTVFTWACKTSKKVANDAPSTAEMIMDEAYRKPINDKDLYAATTELVPLDTVFFASDTMHIITKKINGCETDNFKLIWNGDLGKTAPAKTSVKIFQLTDAQCKERHKFHLIYNISAFKLKNDTSSVKVTQIRIGGWKRIETFSHN